MKPARLISTEGSAFGSFLAPFKVDFPETGLVLLRGENLDTKGSSASGKSTFIHAINYPFGTCPVPLTALQSWYTKEAPKSTDTYDIDGSIVRVTRGKRFLLEIDGAPFNGSADQKEEKLDKLFGINAEMRKTLTYRGQRKPGLFLSKTDKQQKEFLTKLLNLDKWDEEHKKALAKAKDLEDRYNVLTARRKDTLARIEALKDQGDGVEAEQSLANVIKEWEEHDALHRKYEKTIAGMEHDAGEVHQFALSLFAPKIAEADEKVHLLESQNIDLPPLSVEWGRLTNMHVVIKERLSRLEAEDLQLARDNLAVIESMRSEWQALALRAGSINKLLADKDRVTADMKTLSKNCCPTCLREWEEAVTRLEDLKIELEQIKGEEEELRDIKAQADALKAELAAMPRTIEENPLIPQMRAAAEKCQADIAAEMEKCTAGARAEREQLNRELADARINRKALGELAQRTASEQHDKVLAGISSVKALVSQEISIKNSLVMTRTKLSEEVGRIRERRAQMEIARVQADGMLEELVPLQVELAREQDFGHLTGREAFRGKVFDEALDAISAETNAMLASIANTRNCTLEFISESLTQDGKLRQEIVPVITINGHKTSLDYGPSGGMLSAIELAVDLAVGKIISERTGVCPGWLILDESFDGLGPREKETCLEILQLYARDRLVIIVDHMSETQGLFTHRITVRNKDGISTIA